MTQLEELEIQILNLSEGEFARLRDWFLQRDSDAWVVQIERDAESGKLEELFRRSVVDTKPAFQLSFDALCQSRLLESFQCFAPRSPAACSGQL